MWVKLGIFTGSALVLWSSQAFLMLVLLSWHAYGAPLVSLVGTLLGAGWPTGVPPKGDAYSQGVPVLPRRTIVRGPHQARRYLEGVPPGETPKSACFCTL